MAEAEHAFDVKSAARRVLEEIFPADDEAALVAAVTPDFVNHEAPPDTPPGPAGVIFYMHALARAFSEQRWTVQRIISEGDTAVVYCTHSGRHTGLFFDLPATGRTFSYRQMHMIRVVNGR
jgi:predicted ester cyclase